MRGVRTGTWIKRKAPFVDFTKWPDIEPTFINIEIALHTAYIRYAIIAFFTYVLKLFCFEKRTDP